MELLAACSIADLPALTADCQRLRRPLGKPATRWTAQHLLAALHEAVQVRGHPASHAVQALRAVAADRISNTPMRLACPGPWWNQPAARPTPEAAAELDALKGRGRETLPVQPWSTPSQATTAPRWPAKKRAASSLANGGTPV